MQRLAAMLAAAVLASTVGASIAGAATLTARGIEMNRFGRIVLEFEQPTKVALKATNGVLVLSFARPVELRNERLARELPSYVTQARYDPDGMGLRLALTQPFRTNLLEAGEKVFIDLLPLNWSGLPPGLPPEVVDALARRAREAEAKAAEEARRREVQQRRRILVRVARLPTLTRLVFDSVGGTPVTLKADGANVELRIDAPARADLASAAGQVGPAIRTIAAEASANSLLVKLVLEEGYEAHGFREDDTFAIDVAKKAVAASAAVEPFEGDKESSLHGPAAPVPAVAAEADSEGARQTLPRNPGEPIRADSKISAEGLTIAFPFTAPTPAAALERGGVVTVVFQTDETVNVPPLPSAAAPLASVRRIVRDGGFTVIRLALAGPHLVRLAAQNERWLLSIGETGLMPTEPLSAKRSVDDLGRTALFVPLPKSSGVYWLEEPEGGERIAVATALGPPRGLPKPQRFTEFRLLPTAHGVAVASDADDLLIKSAAEGVAISREMGLTLTLDAIGEGGRGFEPVVGRDRWMKDRLGAVLERQRELMSAVTDAPWAGRAAARLELARFLVANGLDFEAVGVLAFAASEDPSFARQRSLLLLQGIALTRMHHDAEARRMLASDVIAEDPEAVLWRTLLDVRARRWTAALAGFRVSQSLLDSYPEDLQTIFFISAARSAIETKDDAFAAEALARASQLAADAVTAQEIALLKARVEQASGHSAAALDIYRKLAEAAERPVAAEAALRWTALALAGGATTREEAIATLETLAVIWRGDEIEIAALGQLGKLYAESGRWRDAFTTARRASRIFPDHEIARGLHEATSKLFEELFLTGRSDTLARVEALALYFDFKEFTPIGRRGDEIVRRLADRLIELDLLDHAGDLLQHQVENRLTGAAKATVAARLATVRLMDGKPQQALQVIQATRLPELPASIKRARILLEARALSDLSRTDLAIEVLAAESGPEIDRLRADILWTGRRWRHAGEAYERLVGTRWQGAEPLSDRERIDIVRAAIAYSLGDEALALDRLRAKFAAKMADSVDARMFGFLTKPDIASTRTFRDIARGVSSADTLADFLAEYRKRYPEAAVAERRPQPSPLAAPQPAPPTPQALAPGVAGTRS